MAIEGRWLVLSGRQQYTLNLETSEHGLRGHIQEGKGVAAPVKIGVFSSDAFLFETSGSDGGWLWSGNIASAGLAGQRENLRTGAVESFSARRLD